MATPDQLLIAEMQGKSFVEAFYSTFDANRPDLRFFYTEKSSAYWDGRPFNANEIPLTKHTIDTVVSHPLVSQPSQLPAHPPFHSFYVLDQEKCPIHVSVSGTVSFSSFRNRAFHHSFILEPSDDPAKAAANVYTISSSIMREVPTSQQLENYSALSSTSASRAGPI